MKRRDPVAPVFEWRSAVKVAKFGGGMLFIEFDDLRKKWWTWSLIADGWPDEHPRGRGLTMEAAERNALNHYRRHGFAVKPKRG
jgi:hypothetical protein